MNIIYYYFHNGTAQEGPFTLEEILKQAIKPNTPIWKEGEPSWQDAVKFSEFSSLFAASQRQEPPPFSSPPKVKKKKSSEFRPTNNTSNPVNKSGVARAIRTLLIVGLIVFGIFAALNIFFRSTSGSGGYSGGGSGYGYGNTSTATYQEKKLSVLEVERANPTQFLSAEGTWNKTLFGKKVKVHGTITNYATVANFKDINIEVTYFSDTKSEIEREYFIIYDFVPAGSTKSFELKMKPPGGTNSLGWDATGATPY